MYLILERIDSNSSYTVCYKYSTLAEAQSKLQELLATLAPSRLQLIEVNSHQFLLNIDEESNTTVTPFSFPVATTTSMGMVQLATLLQANYTNPIDTVNDVPLSVQPSLIKAMIDAGLANDNLYTNTHAPSVTTVKGALNDLYERITYTPLIIDSYTTARTLYDKGQSADVIFLWGYNKEISSQTLDGVTVTNTLRTSTVSGINTSKNIVLSANDGTNTVAQSIYIDFSWRVYWGVSAQTTNLDQSFIKNLENSLLSNSYKGEYQFNQTNNTYGYIACPTSFNMPSIAQILGLDTDLYLCSNNIDLTNDYGQNTIYSLYRTTNTNLGQYTMVLE